MKHIKNDRITNSTEKPLHQQLKGWEGHSKKGEAIYDAVFQQEKAEGDLHYCACGNMKSPNEKYCGWGCIAEIG